MTLGLDCASHTVPEDLRIALACDMVGLQARSPQGLAKAIEDNLGAKVGNPALSIPKSKEGGQRGHRETQCKR
jgi:hypothetical protein